jgi:hypothetical protein
MGLHVLQKPAVGQDHVHGGVDETGGGAVVDQFFQEIEGRVLDGPQPLLHDGHGPVAGEQLVGIRDRLAFVKPPDPQEFD